MEHRKVFWAAALGRLSFIYKMGEEVKGVVAAIDIPRDWNPRAKQQPTGLIAYGATHRRPVLIPLDTPPKKKSAVAKQQRIFGGVPSGIRTHGLQIHNLAR